MEIFDVKVGHVTRRRGARLHLVVAGGRAYCGAGAGAIIDSRTATAGIGAHVCRRCAEAMRIRLVSVINIRTRRSNPGYDLYGVASNRDIVAACEALIDGMTTPAESAWMSKMREGIQRNMDAARGRIATSTTQTSQSEDKLTLF